MVAAPAANKVRPEIIQAQPGGQTAFLSTPADIALFGGHAGASKSFSLLLEATRHLSVPGFSAVIFRRTYPQIMNEGGLWDDSFKIYPQLGGVPIVGETEWRFPEWGSTVSFRHMQHVKNRTDWDGSQIPLVEFDEIQWFEWIQVAYMFSRMRTNCGVRPYQRWTANPPANPRRHWLRKLVDWWIGEDGFPIQERSGVIRYLTIDKDRPVWGATPQEVIEKTGNPKLKPRSFTFIPGTLADNPRMTEKDPDYEANLEMLPEVDKLRLKGNWNVEISAGSYFKREWWRFVPAVPDPQKCRWTRYWDRAATAWDPDNPGDREEPSKTAGVLMAMDQDGRIYIKGLRAGWWTPREVELEVVRAAETDGKGVEVGIEQDPGQAGIKEAQSWLPILHGYRVWLNAVREHKGNRAKPFSAQVQGGNVYIVGRPDDPWVEEYISEMEAFDGEPGGQNDVGDASSGAYLRLAMGPTVSAPLRR